jgi:hypothetical protein
VVEYGLTPEGLSCIGQRRPTIDWTEAGGKAQVDGGPLAEDLREQVHYLRSILNEEREARRRADMIIAQLTQANAALAAKVPELEAPQEAQGAPQSVMEEPDRAGPQSGTDGAQEATGRSWWRRMFGC